jgi:hypothetical protein
MTKETTRYEGFDVDVAALCAAAYKTLNALADMTSEDFSRGGDRECRRALAKALGHKSP